MEDPKRLEGVNVDDLVEITYRRALAVWAQERGRNELGVFHSAMTESP